MIRRMVLIVLVSIPLVPGVSVGRGVEFESLSATSTFVGILGVLPEGGVNCIGGEPTGEWPVCSSGSTRSVIRGILLGHYQTSFDSPFSGFRVTVLNANLDREGRGPMWGTWRLELEGDAGISEGTYTGSMDPTSIRWHAVGYGTEGSVEGINSRLLGVADANLNEEFTGYYFLPAGKGNR